MAPTEVDTANPSASYALSPPPAPSAPPNTRAAGSPTLGNPDFQPLLTDQLFRQRPGATISRQDTPFPFSRQFSNGSQHGVGSTQSSPTLQYLSPPIIDSGGETPPYKPDQDDYFSLNLLSHRKRHRPGFQHSDRSGSRDVSGSGSALLHSIDETLSRSHDDLSLAVSELMKDHGDIPDSTLQTQKKTAKDSLEQNAREKPLILVPRRRRSHFFLGTRGSSDPTSSNAEASSDVKDSKAGESSPEHGSMVRIWSTKNDSRKRRKNNTSEESRGSKGKGWSSGKLETPATITLRKASVLCGATVTEYGLQTPGISARPLIDPAAATSIREGDPPNYMADRSGSHALPVEGTLPLSEQGVSNGDADNHTGEKPGPEQESAKIVERPFASSGLQRQRTAANPTITFADVHTAPRTFSISSTSRKSSLSLFAQLKRKSAVNSISRNSVHEIIWKEDDLPSGCSSDEARSPSLPLSRMTTGAEGSGDDAGSGSPVFAENLSASPPKFTVSEMPGTVSQDNSGRKHARALKAGHDLFGWSWSRRSSTKTKAKEDSANFSGHVTPIDPYQEASLRKRSTARRTKSVIIPNADSFSPLPEQKPADGQMTLQASFNVSQAGHTPYVGITPSTPSELAHSSPSGDASEQRRSSSIKSHPYAPTRVAQESKEGCAIGSSSHKRRMSHWTPYCRLNRSDNDSSRPQTRKPSLSRRLSSVDNFRSQDGARVPPVEGASYSKSADTPYITSMSGSGLIPLALTAEPVPEEACRHGARISDGSRTDLTDSTYITDPLQLVSTPDARADCKSCEL